MHAVIADFLADCLQNSVEAGAGYITLNYTVYTGDKISVEIKDNGKGMSGETLKKIQDPFYTDGTKHVKRKVGLGIPFLMQAVALSGGDFGVESELGKGTTFRFSFDLNNIDTPPQGDVNGAVVQAMMYDGGYELEYNKAVVNQGVEKSYKIKRTELIDALGCLSDPSAIKMAKVFLSSQDEDLF